MEESCPSQKSRRGGEVGTGRRKKDRKTEREDGGRGRHLARATSRYFLGTESGWDLTPVILAYWKLR